MGLFKKEKNTGKKESARDRLELISVNDQKDVLKLADKIMCGIPLCLNFEGCVVQTANEVLSFLSGVIYAVDGEIISLKKDVFVFCQKEDYRDVTLRSFIERYKE